MSDQMSFLLFGDQSSDTYTFLSDFCRRGNPSLLSQSFLQQVSVALKAEVNTLSVLYRKRIPDFSSVEQLNRRYYESRTKYPAVDSALLSIAQLAHYIDRAEKVHTDITQPCDTNVIGLCAGLFAAAAVASAPSLSALVPIAVQVVMMAFRTGVHVAATADRLHQTGDTTESWTFVVPSVGETTTQSIITKFNDTTGISLPNRAYISAIMPNSIAISGPPSTLKALFATEPFDTKAVALPIHGPYHAAHLYSSTDIEKLLHLDDPKVSSVLNGALTKTSIMSCTTGTWYAEKDTKSLLRAVVSDILNEPLQFKLVLAGCVAKAKKYQGSQVLVIPFGATPTGKSLATVLKAQTDLEIVLRQPTSSEKDSNASEQSSKKCKLAIVGMAGRFPDAATHEKLWELLEKGLDVHREVPQDRFDVKTHVDPSGKAMNTSHTPFGCWIENPGLFDPRFFNMSPREAFQTDPMQRMALSTAFEALEMSGYVPNRTPSTRLDRIGTFYGQTSDDWREINAAQEVDTYFITGGVRAFGPGRINYHFGFSGPSFSVDTACSSSMAAMQLACTSLWAGDCDTAVVGGMSCMTNSDIFAGLSRGQFLSKKGPCATFDNDADGYCRADAVGTVIVKRLEDAEADKDNVLAVILGTATNHSADAISITHPHGGTQEILYKNILDAAGVDPLDIDYVEMHGTGTQAGDGTEMRSVTNVFAPAQKKRTSKQPLYLGSVKANVGHGEAASGITAIIKCLMMLKKNAIPPHVGIKGTINKTFPSDLSERNVNIAFHKTPLVGRPGEPRRIYISNFSAAGGNSGLLIQDGPTQDGRLVDPRSKHVVAVSGKSKSAMIRNVERLVTYLEENPNTALPDLAYTTTARKIHHPWRMTVNASDINQVKVDLKSKLNDSVVPVPQETPKMAFLFTGQGSHYAGLGKDFFQTSSLFRETILEFNNIATVHGFPSFLPLIDGSEADVQSLSPIVVQLGLVCFEMAMAKLWASWGITPSVVVGHSLGEYAALHVAGVLSASDTIFLVGSRAQRLMEDCTAGTHSMLAVQGSVDSVTEALKERAAKVNVACVNGPRETVLSGLAAEMTDISARLSQAGFKCTMLKVPFAFHSAQVDPILDSFEKLAEAAQFNPPKVPIISPLLGRLLSDVEGVDPIYLRRHAREPVNFMGGLVAAQEGGVIDEKTIWLECGPHPVCVGFVKAAFGVATIAAPTLRRNESTFTTLTNSLSTLHTAGVAIDWNEYHRDFKQCVSLLDLPTYSFDDKNYWIQYTGDWCLTKGKASTGSIALLEDSKPKLSTTTVQNVTHESVNGDIATVSIESDIGREDLRAAVSGHLVNGAALCPSSIYADMALTVCEYAYKLVRPNTENVGMNVSHMEVVKPLIGRNDGKPQIVKLTVKADINLGRADLVFSSGSEKSYVEHATCKVYYGDNTAYLAEWQRSSYLIQSRIDWLKEQEVKGNASKIGRGLAYKLFASLVDYDPKYRGMQEVILSSGDMEATSIVKFQTTEKDGTFNCSPYWIDSVAHISGFIVNGSDAVDSKAQVYVSHGWESLRVAEPLSAEKTYRSYVKMQSIGGTMVAGDVFVFDGDRIVAMVGSLKFQRIPRTLLNTFLPPAGGAATRNVPARVAQPQTVTSRTVRSKKTVETAQVTTTNLQTVNKKLTSIVSLAFDILAKEIGVGHDELVDNVAFADLGVDSLMGLTVSGRMREELEIDIHSSVFNDCTNIGQFKTYLAQFERRESYSSATTESDLRLTDDSTPDLEDSSPISTPDDDSGSEISKDDMITPLSDIIRTTIAEEMGFDVEEIVDAHDLGELGMDSLMSLSILGTLREKTGMSLPADLLITNPSVHAIEKSLNIVKVEKSVTKAVKFKEITEVSQVKTSQAIIARPERFASSVLLQGNSRTAKKFLWMVPDGSGSATSYTDIPDIASDLAVWGLFSPYMKTPEEYNCGVIGMAEKFIIEMKRRQPTGPYLLAGWSAGGVIAFEAVNQLIKSGETVENLIIIDAPCPLIIEPLPASLHRWFASIGLLGEGDDASAKKVPSWLLPHFAASVNALSNYTAESIDPEKCPNVTAIWCEDGVCKLPSDPRPDPFPYGHAQFLLDNRTDFGPNLWDVYLDKEKISTRTIPNCNHFSMMKGVPAKMLGDLIREAVV